MADDIILRDVVPGLRKNSVTPPLIDTSVAGRDGTRPEPSSVFFDADYPATPEYSEVGALFFDSNATGAANGTTWADAYTNEETALNALCASAAGTSLICKGLFTIPAPGISLTGDGGVGNASAWYQFRAHPVDGCQIGSSGGVGIEFGGQAYWIVSGFEQVSGSRIFSYYPGGSSSGGVDHMTFRDITGTMTAGGDNVGTIHMDTAGADYIGVFNANVTGPGNGVHGNTGCIFLSRVPHWRVMNCELKDAPQVFYYKHFETASYAGAGNQFFENNYIPSGANVKIGGKGISIKNNIILVNLDIMDDGGGDNGTDDNIIEHNTLERLNLSNLDSLAQDNIVKNNIILSSYQILRFQTAVASTNISNYNLYVGNSIYYQNTEYTLSNWQANSVPVGQDTNSITGTPSFIGGTSPTTISGFALNGGPGISASDDGTDMGADTTKVGNM